jgi:hypothetical protein
MELLENPTGGVVERWGTGGLPGREYAKGGE